MVVVLTIAASGCADKREGPAAIALVTWKDDVAAVVGARCATAGCHSGGTPQASYDLSTYQGALGRGTDPTANAIAGDAGSLILTELDTLSHVGVVDVLPLLRAWVVDSNLAYERSRIHEPGLLDPSSPQFHGAELRARGWSFSTCQNCHGVDFAGGKSGASCLTCHANGPTACDTCHDAVPTTGAHLAHVGRGIACNECHRVPVKWDDPGHILDANGAVDPPPAEVALGALAGRDVTPPRRTAPPAYEASTQTCSAIYCHGGVLGDHTATNTTPVWTAGPAATACGTCHGAPPANHAQSECAVCHPTTVAPGGGLLAAHIDGAIQTGDGSSPCAGCHGNASSAAPPRGLHGELYTSALGVGAHRAHLEAPRGLRGPIACGECHLVPAAVGDAGHIDSALPAEVFPLGAGTLARTDGAVPTWDRTSASCSSTYCHGGGTHMARDLTPGVRAPVWTATGSQVYCGSCHGIPPADLFHASTLTIADCTTCHPSVDATGNIVLTGPAGAQTSEHLDGIVTFR